MKITNKVLELLENDRDVRLKVALAEGKISEAGLLAAVKRERDPEVDSKAMTSYAMIKAIKLVTGLPESKILELQSTTA